MTPHHIWFRRILLVLGIAIGLAATPVVNAFPVLRLIQFVFQDDERSAIMAHLLSLLAVLLFSLLSMVVSWGLKQGWTWAFWGGRFCAVVLISGVPWLTPFGIYGLYALRHRPERAPAPPHARMNAVLLSILRLSAGAAVLNGWVLILKWAPNWGLPPGWLGYWVWGVLLAGELVVTTVHEFGHALMTRAVGFRLQSICIGPLTLWSDSLRQRHYRWTWSNLFGHGGYVGGLPVSGEHVRGNMIIVVLAGPAASILASLTLFSATLGLAGTGLAGYWEFVAALSLLFAVDGVWNLIPAGRNDGGMLLSLILWNEKGRQLVADLMSGKLHEDSTSLRMQGDTEAEIRMLQRALAEQQEAGISTPETLFRRRLELGFAQLRAGDRAEAEEHLLECLKLLGEMTNANPSYAANIWMGLRGVYENTERPADATRAYESSLAAFEEVLRQGPRPQELGAIRAALAGMHCSENQFQRGLDEIDRALPYFPSDGLTRAGLLSHRAECEFNLGFQGRGLEAVKEAEKLIRAEIAHAAKSRQAVAHLAVLAGTLEEGDHREPAIALLREALERDEAAGLHVRARALRYKLCRMLRREQRVEEAWAMLPALEEILEKERADYILVRARIHLAAGETGPAIDDFEEAGRLLAEKHTFRKVLIAQTQCELAEAYQVSGGAHAQEAARALAQRAIEVLHPLENADEADALVTLALLDWPAPDLLARALGIVSTNKDLRAFQKIRAFEAIASRLERAGLAEPAAVARASACSAGIRAGVLSH